MSAASNRLEELRWAGKAEERLRILHGAQLSPEAALGVLPVDGTSLGQLQRAYFLQKVGQWHEAQQVLDNLPALAGGLEVCRKVLVKESVESAPFYSRDIECSRAPMSSRTLAALHAAQGDTNTAIAMYRELLARDPDDRQSRQQLAELLGEDLGSEGLEALQRWLRTVQAWRQHLGV